MTNHSPHLLTKNHNKGRIRVATVIYSIFEDDAAPWALSEAIRSWAVLKSIQLFENVVEKLKLLFSSVGD
ncbi:hypothetical protein Nepgr_031368 [Nepenthes gracilis]|uniref:Uncharacterized protein n=1 Tax=Nepenthes gracilis TaxID=150966 RepID=A0AAD3TGL3_NEPGR|nr:hypothetical protein Nepgr_031368 [Nepenthes gracilis]